jgi:BCD family chlorophyll transporter-like MFS transporter
MVGIGWISIARLGLVQAALGAIVVLMTSTINRVMVVELALPAFVPGILVASHYAIQILRPAWGYGSDVGGRRTPWIVGGMAALALGGTGAALAFLVAVLAAMGIERGAKGAARSAPSAARPPFREAFGQVWREPAAREFTIFIFVSMLAYSAQELLVEPFGGLVFGMTPGATTKLAGLQHGGVLTGMLGVAFAASAIGGPILGSLRMWTVAGCLASSASLVAIAASGFASAAGPLRAAVFALGVSNGAFAVAAIGSMMSLAGAGAGSREGTRMGLWGAAQAVAFGLGGFVGTVAVDVVRRFVSAPLTAYDTAFVGEAILFLDPLAAKI